MRAGEKRAVFVYHDEASAKTNGEQRSYWGTEWAQVLRKQNEGANFMVSDFIDSVEGYVKISDERLQAETAAADLMANGDDMDEKRGMLPEQAAARVMISTGRVETPWRSLLQITVWPALNGATRRATGITGPLCGKLIFSFECSTSSTPTTRWFSL